jgi:hypothetical protein
MLVELHHGLGSIRGVKSEDDARHEILSRASGSGSSIRPVGVDLGAQGAVL